MSEFQIRREVTGARGRYIIHHDDAEAELIYSIVSPRLVIADHTGVPETLRGTGAGRALVRRIVEDAMAEQFKIVPHCSFVNAEREKHADWSDAFTV